MDEYAYPMLWWQLIWLILHPWTIFHGYQFVHLDQLNEKKNVPRTQIAVSAQKSLEVTSSAIVVLTAF